MQYRQIGILSNYGNLLLEKREEHVLFRIVSKPWASIKEISLIANYGRDAAIKIRNKIEEEIIKDGKKIPKGKTIVVPTEKSS